MKLDIHTHILPAELPDLNEKFGYPGWISIRKNESDANTADMYKGADFFRRIEKNCWCLKRRHEDMTKTNVSCQVLSTVPVMFNYWAKPEHTLELARILNDDIALSIKNFRNENDNSTLKQFYGFGTIPMQDPVRAIEEMTRCSTDLGFKGIQIGSHINDWNLDSKQLYPIWKVYNIKQ
jgi:aminocarboxymuconate-semialdehyde decarboxylase